MLKLPYQQLLIWQKSMHLARDIYVITKNFPLEEKNGLISQMRRSAISIPSNIAEGSQRGTNKDFAKFICIAKGSLAELETQILLSRDIEFINEFTLDTVIKQTIELSKMINAFLSKLT